MEAVLTLYSVCIEDFPLLSEEKHCKMRLSLKGEKKKKKPVSVPFFSIKKKKKSFKTSTKGELDSSGQFRFSHVTETLPPALTTWLQL